jgi:hypothetical protein
MPNDITKLITELSETETDFYAKLVPSLIKELSASRKLVQASKLEHNTTKEILARVYNDYNKELSRSYRLFKSVKTWKVVSLTLLTLLVTFLTLGAI